MAFVLRQGDLSQGELERITRRYTSEILELIGPNQDIAGPDLNTDEQTMAWIMDTYSVNIGYTVPSIVTGKPQSIGGSLVLAVAVHRIWRGTLGQASSRICQTQRQ